ncbi:hypothetical protein [Undibacterium sp. TS12]|uniref:hypothetical protein n=1 Tax=Undibacterium sp. TS12 TaxID=2908202 RepID=UPI001F4CAE14|nr:hypothetical protein [Undibacterium sp. TS12]MCH8618004.1 hypothetical protein [Undibacterium sp. TS12]
MPTTEILLAAANFLLLIGMSRMVWKIRAARDIAMRLLTDDLFYYEARGELIQKNVESARLVWGRVRVSAVAQIPVTIPQNPKAAWNAALHTSTRLPKRARTVREPAPATLDVPHSLWVSTFASGDSPWSATVKTSDDKDIGSHARSDTTKRNTSPHPLKTGRDMLELGFMSRAM